MKVNNPMNSKLRVTMPDGSKWDVPVKLIAENRAEHYKGEFGDDLQRSLKEDTIPLFKAEDYEIQDWAANNMNWSDVREHAIRVTPADDCDFDDGWANGDKEIITP